MSLTRDLFTSLFIILTGVFAVLASREYSKDNSSLYQKVNAKITESESESIYDDNNNRSINIYAVYKYTVDKNDYRGRYLHGNYSVLFQQMGHDEILNGKRDIEVYYEKANPSNSAKSFPKNNFILYAAITVACVIGALIAAFVPVASVSYNSGNNYQQSRFY
jgi:hypothetical protein